MYAARINGRSVENEFSVAAHNKERKIKERETEPVYSAMVAEIPE